MDDNFFLGVDFDQASVEPINFLETRLNDLSPFSAHEVEIEGVVYKTAEHAYHSLRVAPELKQKVMAATSPMNAWRVAQECKESGRILDSYNKDKLMEIIFRAKLEQHQDIKRVLKLTQGRELLKVFGSDYYWGTGADGSGQNKMGKLWMKLRAELE